MKAKSRSTKPRSRAATRQAAERPATTQKKAAAARKTTATKMTTSAKRRTKPLRASAARSISVSSAGPARRAAIPDRWKWHYQALSTLRDRFIGDCQERLRDAAQPIEPHSMSMVDSASDDFDHHLALTFLASGQLALTEVEAALARIESGTYGVCEESKKAIPAARLRAVPWTRYRTEVEARREQKNGPSTPPRANPPRPR